MMNSGTKVIIVNLQTVDLHSANHSFTVAMTKVQANRLGEALIKWGRSR